MKRRDILRLGALTPLVPLACKEGKPPATESAQDANLADPEPQIEELPSVLTADQRAALAAVCARILPTDQDPGATEAHCAAYIDSQLAFPPVDGYRGLIEAALRHLDKGAKRRHNKKFSDLEASQQDVALQSMSNSKRGSGRKFMEIMITLTAEGFLCDPVYGGNHNRVGWKMLGFKPQGPGPHKPFRSRSLG